MNNDFENSIPEELVRMYDSLSEAWGNYHNPIPNLLFHYTSSDGLIGILTSKSFWMTDLRFMNDLSELQYAKNILKICLEDRLMKSSEVLHKTFCERLMRDDTFSFNDHNTVYSTSFCEHGNLLSQWRAYRGRGGGYSIGIDFFHSQYFLDKPCNLRRVIYNQNEQKEIIFTIIDRFISEITAHCNNKRFIENMHLVYGTFKVLMMEHLPLFKHPDFHEEREWRLIYFEKLLPTNKRIANFPKFRSYEGNIIPYITFSLEKLVKASRDDTLGIAFPFSKINIGPTINSELNSYSVKNLLYSLNFDIEPSIKSSDIPLRWL